MLGTHEEMTSTRFAQNLTRAFHPGGQSLLEIPSRGAVWHLGQWMYSMKFVPLSYIHVYECLRISIHMYIYSSMIRDREVWCSMVAKRFSWKVTAPTQNVIWINQQPCTANAEHHWPQTGDCMLFSHLCKCGVHTESVPQNLHNCPQESKLSFHM